MPSHGRLSRSKSAERSRTRLKTLILGFTIFGIATIAYRSQHTVRNHSETSLGSSDQKDVQAFQFGPELADTPGDFLDGEENTPQPTATSESKWMISVEDEENNEREEAQNADGVITSPPHGNLRSGEDTEETEETEGEDQEDPSSEKDEEEEPVETAPPQTTEPPTLDPIQRRIRDACYNERDFGLIDSLQNAAQKFCQSSTDSSRTTKVSHYRAPLGGISSALFENIALDFSQAKIASPITDIAEDGYKHDPRFKYSPQIIHCACSEVSHSNPPLNLWDQIFARRPANFDQPLLCNDPTKTPTKPAEISFSDQILVLARKDDHNPFFQISATLNAWIMMQVVGWEPRQTRLLQLDGGFPSAVDELQRRILSPNHEMIFGLSLLNKTVHFESMLLAPYEVSGPMMQHLDNKEPCYDSDLVKKFRAISLSKFGISDKKSNPNMCTITIITRRNYGGRVIQRRWVNEDDIVDHMREDYEYCTFQSIDFVDLSLEKQMTIAKESDMIIGMHGAGMVNVFWSRPGTQIIEIFPKKRFRWGYRNLCQFIGCDWIEFRGGVDIGNGDNASDKAIFYEEWKEFFDPLYEKLIKKVFNE